MPYIRNSTCLSTFKDKLNAFYLDKFRTVLDQESIESYKIVGPKCHKANP